MSWWWAIGFLYAGVFLGLLTAGLCAAAARGDVVDPEVRRSLDALARIGKDQ